MTLTQRTKRKEKKGREMKESVKQKRETESRLMIDVKHKINSQISKRDKRFHFVLLTKTYSTHFMVNLSY
jgi:hypothetical protein